MQETLGSGSRRGTLGECAAMPSNVDSGTHGEMQGLEIGVAGGQRSGFPTANESAGQHSSAYSWHELPHNSRTEAKTVDPVSSCSDVPVGQSRFPDVEPVANGSHSIPLQQGSLHSGVSARESAKLSRVGPPPKPRHLVLIRNLRYRHKIHCTANIKAVFGKFKIQCGHM